MRGESWFVTWLGPKGKRNAIEFSGSVEAMVEAAVLVSSGKLRDVRVHKTVESHHLPGDPAYVEADGPEDVGGLTPCTIDRVGGVADDDVGAEADGVAVTISVHGPAADGRGVAMLSISAAAGLASDLAKVVSEMIARRNP